MLSKYSFAAVGVSLFTFLSGAVQAQSSIIPIELHSSVWIEDQLGTWTAPVRLLHHSGDLLSPDANSAKFSPPIRTTTDLVISMPPGTTAIGLTDNRGQVVAGVLCDSLACILRHQVVERDPDTQRVMRLPAGTYVIHISDAAGSRQHKLRIHYPNG